MALLACPRAVSFLLGGLAAELIGHGIVSVIVLIAVAFAAGVFLSVYVWLHVNGPTGEIVKVMNEKRPS
jgi:hypothetical protein